MMGKKLQQRNSVDDLKSGKEAGVRLTGTATLKNGLTEGEIRGTGIQQSSRKPSVDKMQAKPSSKSFPCMESANDGEGMFVLPTLSPQHKITRCKETENGVAQSSGLRPT